MAGAPLWLPIDATWPFIHLERSFMHLGFHIYDVGFQSRNSEAGRPMVFVTTLLLNFIVLLFVSAMLDGPMKDPTAMGWPQSVALQDALQLDKLIARSRVHTGLLGALAASVVLWLLLRGSTLGLEIRAVGSGARAAAFAGMPVAWVTVKVALLSTGSAGGASAGGGAVREGAVLGRGAGGATHPQRDGAPGLPIIMVNAGDPIGAKFVASLARPGGDLTGTSAAGEEILSKQVELLSAAVPQEGT